MEQSLVSIVIPIYNEEKYLEECLESLINQTYKNLEIICVDDGSTDSSLSILKAYKDRDKRIKIITQQNMYAGVARNKGLEVANGKYVCFLDSDDFFDYSMIENMTRQAERTHADIIICGARGYDDVSHKEMTLASALNYNLVPNVEVFAPIDIANNIFQLTVGWAWDKLYRMDFIRKNALLFQDTRIANDARFVFIAYAIAERISVVHGIYVIHRTNVVNSLEYNRQQYWECGVRMAYGVKKELDKRKLFEIYKDSYSRCMRQYFVWLIESLYEYDLFHAMFNKMKNEIIDDLFLLHETTYTSKDELFLNETKNIKTLPEAVYLFNKYFSKKSNGFQKRRWILDENVLPKGANVVVYGYGDVGKDITKQIKEKNRLNLVKIIDKKLGKEKGEILKDISSVSFDSFDFVIIAVVNLDMAYEIKNSLISKGIDYKRIIWDRKIFRRRSDAE